MRSTGVVIPLYTYPTDDSWNELVQVHASHPSVPTIAVINPSNGPGGSRDRGYVTGIENLKNAGITVLGYLYTKYGQRSRSSVESEASAYKRWYNTNGIMLDEMSNTPGFESYYSSVNDYVKSLGMTYTMGNPGTGVPSSFTGVLDCFVIYENSGLPQLSVLQGFAGYEASKLAYISYGVSKLDKAFETASAAYVGWLYITDAGLPNPYDELPSYFRTEVATLDTGTSTTASKNPRDPGHDLPPAARTHRLPKPERRRTIDTTTRVRRLTMHSRGFFSMWSSTSENTNPAFG